MLMPEGAAGTSNHRSYPSGQLGLSLACPVSTFKQVRVSGAVYPGSDGPQCLAGDSVEYYKVDSLR